MKQFEKVRSLDEIRTGLSNCLFLEDSTLYDDGSDFIDFFGGWLGDQYVHSLLIDPSLGRFIVDLTGCGDDLKTERSGDMDGVDWYCRLLELIYAGVMDGGRT